MTEVVVDVAIGDRNHRSGGVALVHAGPLGRAVALPAMRWSALSYRATGCPVPEP